MASDEMMIFVIFQTELGSTADLGLMRDSTEHGVGINSPLEMKKLR